MIRSLLYVPANSQRFVARAHERGADAIILDLEDSVIPSEKTAARAALRHAVPNVGQCGALVFVRINSDPELEFGDAEAACTAGADGLFVPKVEVPQRLSQLAALLDNLEAGSGRKTSMSMIAAIESATGLFEARAIATADPRVIGLNAGSEDMAKSMNAEPVPEVLRLPKLMVHLAAKASGKLSIGLIRSVADFKDSRAVAAAAREARQFGFDGATCIHPSIVPVLNEAFAPSAEEVERAKRLVVAANAAADDGIGAFLFEGRMVDAPIVDRAKWVLDRNEYFNQPRNSGLQG